MKTGTLLGVVVAAFLSCAGAYAAVQAAPLPTPGFHHLMLNSVNPDAAIAFYTKAFPTTSKTVWEGYPALASPNHVLILFSKVSTPPDWNSQTTAYWHFGWNAVDERKKVAFLNALPGMKFAPLYTGNGDRSVQIWVAKLKREGVTFLRQSFKIGDTRAVMIEGPSHEAIELVEVK